MTNIELPTISHPLADQIAIHAKFRPMKSIKPGWWVRSYDDTADQLRETWNPVLYAMSGENMINGQKFVRVVMRDQESPADGVEVTDTPDSLALCCTAAEAKRAGLVAVEVPAGGAR